jgi:hypothetical protein
LGRRTIITKEDSADRDEVSSDSRMILMPWALRHGVILDVRRRHVETLRHGDGTLARQRSETLRRPALVGANSGGMGDQARASGLLSGPGL